MIKNETTVLGKAGPDFSSGRARNHNIQLSSIKATSKRKEELLRDREQMSRSIIKQDNRMSKGSLAKKQEIRQSQLDIRAVMKPRFEKQSDMTRSPDSSPDISTYSAASVSIVNGGIIKERPEESHSTQTHEHDLQDPATAPSRRSISQDPSSRSGCDENVATPLDRAIILLQSSTSKTNPPLTPFRRRVLLALCQVPQGQFTTYAAMSEFLNSCPRAVGNAMRNNPLAPTVPCHRVLAADGRIGGFGGSWGEAGEHAGEKRKLLRAEGVRFDGMGRVVGRVWKGFT